MYLRKSKKPNGRTYLTIVQGYRDEDGKNKARTVRSLGYVDALEAEFDDPVAHFEEECRRMTAEAARAEAPIAVEFTASKKIDKRAEGRVELGAAVPSAYLHRDLGIWSFDLCQDFGHGSSRNHAAMGSLPSAGLVRSKNNSMARAGIW